MYESHPRKVFNRIGLGLFVYLSVAAIVEIIVELLVLRFAPGIAKQYWYAITLGAFSMYAVGFPIAFLVWRTIPKQEVARKDAPNYSKCLPFLFLLVPVALGFSNIIGIIIETIVVSVAGQSAGSQVVSMLEAAGIVLSILQAVLLAPLVEETIFRGILYKKVEPFGSKFAILFTAAMFALFHGDYAQTFYVLPVGLALAYVRSYTGSIKYTILMHSLYNLIGGIVIGYLPAVIANMLGLAFTFSAFAFFLLWIVNKWASKLYLYDGIYPKPTMKQILLNPGMILFGASSLYGIIQSLLPAFIRKNH